MLQNVIKLAERLQTWLLLVVICVADLGGNMIVQAVADPEGGEGTMAHPFLDPSMGLKFSHKRKHTHCLRNVLII